MPKNGLLLFRGVQSHIDSLHIMPNQRAILQSLTPHASLLGKIGNLAMSNNARA